MQWLFGEVISSVEEPFFHLGDLLEKSCRFLHQLQPYLLIYVVASYLQPPRAATYIGTLCVFSENPLGLSWNADLVLGSVCLDSIGAYISILHDCIISNFIYA